MASRRVLQASSSTAPQPRYPLTTLGAPPASMQVTVQQLDKRPRRLQIHTSLHTLYIFEDHMPHVRPGQAAVLQHALASPPVAATSSKNAIGNTILSNAQSALPRPPGNRPDGILVSLALVSVAITVQFRRLAWPRPGVRALCGAPPRPSCAACLMRQASGGTTPHLWA